MKSQFFTSLFTTVVTVLVTQPAFDQVIQVTNVQLNPTDQGLEIILETLQGEQLQVLTNTSDNTYIADIPSSQLRLPFNQENPILGITQITVTNNTANSIWVTVTGSESVPTVELFDGDEGLIFGVTPASLDAVPPEDSKPVLEPQPRSETIVPPAAEEPRSETQPPQTSASDDEPIELVVTGEQDGYSVPDASTATRTDTPLRDIPQSIQVIPRQLLEDRQITRVEEVADNVPGVQPLVSYGGIETAQFFIRGFSGFNVYRDGFREFSFANPININNIERIEFLKGPASVLYGQNEPGGLVNIVSEQPLTQPYYSPSFTIGSFDYYQGALDLSGLLNAQRTAAYRLNLAYENAGSFREGVDSENVLVAPALSFQLGPRTDLTFNFEYQHYEYTFDRGFPAQPEVFEVPVSRFLGEQNFDNAIGDYGRISYVLEHRFSENWKLRQGFVAAIADTEVFQTLPRSLEADRRTVNRDASISDESQENYTLQNEIFGKFQTGAIAHQVLLGVELLRYRFTYGFRFGSIAPIDLFDPIYGAEPENLEAIASGDKYGTDAASFYFQDQITLLDNLKVLLGGRFDLARTIDEQRPSGDLITDTTDFAFSPRAGIVYQPIEPISLYLSYATSFNPVIFGTSARGESFQPETGEQFEAGIKADLLSNRLSATLAFYELTKENVLITDPDNPLFSLQTGEQKSRGIEFNLVGRPVEGWDVSLSYALSDAFVSEDTTIPIGDKLAGAAEHQFGLWNSYQLQEGSLRGLGFGLGLYYVSNRAAVLPNTDVDLPSYFRVDASIFYKRDNWKV